MLQKSFSKIWILLIVAIIVAGGVLVWQYWLGPEMEMRAVERVVQEFYQCYIGIKEVSVGDSAEECYVYLDKRYQEDVFSKEWILVNPLLWMSDIPLVEDLEIGEATIQNGNAWLIVKVWGKDHLRIFLSLSNDEWKITNIERLLPEVQITTKTIEEEKVPPSPVTYKIDIEMPEIVGLLDAAVYLNLHQEMNEHISDIISEFKEEAERRMAYQGKSGENRLEMKYKVSLLTDSFFSVLYSKTTDGIGAAHPYESVSVFNYDLSGNKQIELADIFKKGTGHLEFLSQFAINDLVNQGISEEDWIRRGAGPEAKNFQDFVLSENNLIIYFNPNQVGSYLSGIHKVTIPYEELKDILTLEISL